MKEGLVRMKLEEFRIKKISEVENIMIRPGEDFFVKDQDEIKKVADKALNVDFHAVILTDEGGKSKKLISSSDVLKAIAAGNQLKPDATLKDVPHIGTKEFAKVRDDATIDEVVKEFKKSGYNYLIVESDQGKPVGLISRGKLIRAIEELSPI